MALNIASAGDYEGGNGIALRQLVGRTLVITPISAAKAWSEKWNKDRLTVVADVTFLNGDPIHESVRRNEYGQDVATRLDAAINPGDVMRGMPISQGFIAVILDGALRAGTTVVGTLVQRSSSKPNPGWGLADATPSEIAAAQAWDAARSAAQFSSASQSAPAAPQYAPAAQSAPAAPQYAAPQYAPAAPSPAAPQYAAPQYAPAAPSPAAPSPAAPSPAAPSPFQQGQPPFAPQYAPQSSPAASAPGSQAQAPAGAYAQPQVGANASNASAAPTNPWAV